MTEAIKELLRQALQDHSPRVLDLVFPVAKTHDFLLAGNRPIQPGSHLVWAADLAEHLQHIFIGAAVQGARQGAHR